eukprot:11894-Heterococcus_DN1.PRE.3
MALATVGCATVQFTTLTLDTLSTVLLHKLVNLKSVNAADVSKCFSATKDAIITDKLCKNSVHFVLSASIVGELYHGTPYWCYAIASHADQLNNCQR